MDGSTATEPHRQHQPKIAAASGWIGSALEYYDFLMYATAASLVFPPAQAQNRFAVGLGYVFNSAWDISATYTNVQYIPGMLSKFADEQVFNTAGTVLHWKPATAWDFAAGYSYTWASKANGIDDAASYHQFNLSQYYALSKRTGFYALEAFQRANGRTLGIPTFPGGPTNPSIAATASIGDGFQSTPSSSRSMFAAGVGIVHRF